MTTVEDNPVVKMDDLVNLCKRKGFIFQSSEIYSPMAGFFDYGPLGVELKNNIKKLWWRDIVQKRDDIVGLDSSIIASPSIWQVHIYALSPIGTVCIYVHEGLRPHRWIFRSNG